jgi:NAD(P)-dependent dehydrogenase (short-subunit alcohol dehydrogenase family)
LFAELLVDNLTRADGARIVYTSSDAHRFVNKGVLNFDDLVRPGNAYQGFPHAYGTSKLMQILYAFECQKIWGDSKKILSFSFNPGFVSSGLGSDNTLGYIVHLVTSPLQRSQDQGASTAVFCALADEALNHAGHYFNDNAYSPLSEEVLDPEKAHRLRELTLNCTGLLEAEETDQKV